MQQGGDLRLIDVQRYLDLSLGKPTPFHESRNPPPQKIPSFSKPFTTTLTTPLIAFFAEFGLKVSLIPVQTSHCRVETISSSEPSAVSTRVRCGVERTYASCIHSIFVRH